MLRFSIEHSVKCCYTLLNILFLIYLLLICRALFITTVDIEATSFDYSTKNIPIPSEKKYSKKEFCKRIRWRAYFFLNPESASNNKETFGFKSKNTPPYVKKLVNFENRMLDMVKNVKFRDVDCNFQKKLSSYVKNIKRNDELL